MKNVKEYVADLKALLASSPIAEQKAFLRAFIKSIVVGSDNVTVILLSAILHSRAKGTSFRGYHLDADKQLILSLPTLLLNGVTGSTIEDYLITKSKPSGLLRVSIATKSSKPNSFDTKAVPPTITCKMQS